MKIWQSYGAEHSSNLVMIGKFKDISDAIETKEVLDSLFERLPDLVDFDINTDRYSDEVGQLLSSKKIYSLSPLELVQFRYDISVELSGDEIRVSTDEDDISAILKILIHNGAKVEVFSAHVHPESGEKE